MKRIILSGAKGKMGQVVSQQVAKSRPAYEIIAGVDRTEDLTGEFPIFDSLEKINIKADVLIDFSHHSALDKILEYGIRSKTPLVICTTGITNKQIERIKAVSNSIPIFYSSNMSLGISLMIELCKKACLTLGQSFDIEIIEKHHNQKLDAPSGTALMLANALSETKDYSCQYVFGRHSSGKLRTKNEIGIHSIRGGSIVGEHEVLFAGPNELFKISHTAESKEIFASGALNAAMFLCANPAGLYDMSAMLNNMALIK